MTWKCVAFEALTTLDLYEILTLRQEVFIVEQTCPYLDTDGKDLYSYHLMGRNEAGKLCAYARLLPIGVSYPQEASIGRVVSAQTIRRTGVGRALMTQAIDWMHQLWGTDVPIHISAQQYLVGFYQSFGFVPHGGVYLEDDIPHIAMTIHS